MMKKGPVRRRIAPHNKAVRTSRSVALPPVSVPVSLRGARVRVFEVGLRDGLQNESRPVSTAQKVILANGLAQAGLKDLELGAFVRPDRVPQMADTPELFRMLREGVLDLGKARTWALVPNRKGLERAAEVGATQLALFTAASDAFCERNMGMSIEASLAEIEATVAEAQRLFGRKLKLRGYLSTVWGCPFQGEISIAQVMKVTRRLAKLPFQEISFGDTIGVATPGGIDALMPHLLKVIGAPRIAVHFHDTRGTALANSLRALEWGVRIVDSSAGGLGGCPFAPGATGNLATEDLIYALNGMGVHTGVNIDILSQTSLALASTIGRPLSSRYLQACTPSS